MKEKYLDMMKDRKKRIATIKRKYSKLINSTDDMDKKDDYRYELNNELGKNKLNNIDYYFYDEDEDEITEASTNILEQYYYYRFAVIDIIELCYKEKHKLGGRPSKLDFSEMLDATLLYLKYTHHTYKEIASIYKIHESNMYEIIKWIMSILLDKKILNKYEEDDDIFYSVNIKIIDEYVFNK